MNLRERVEDAADSARPGLRSTESDDRTVGDSFHALLCHPMGLAPTRHVAESLLILARRPDVIGVRLVSDSSVCRVTVEQCKTTRSAGLVPHLGRAVALRLAFIASLDPWSAIDRQCGVVRQAGTADLVISAHFSRNDSYDVGIRRLTAPSGGNTRSR